MWPAAALAVLILLPAGALVVLRLVPDLQLVSVLGRPRALALVSSFIAWGTLLWGLAAVLLALTLARAVSHRSRTARVGRSALVLITVLTVLAGSGLALQLSWLAPVFVPDGRRVIGPTVTVLSLNVHIGGADAGQVVARSQTADIVVLVETTPDDVAALADAGMDERFRYRVGAERGGPSGASVYSRYPIREVEDLHTSFQQRVTEVEVPSVGRVTLIAAHPCNPYCGIRLWQRESVVLRETAARYAEAGPTVIAGDFNAVDDHLPMQRLRQAGFASAADVAGAGLLPTFPANRAFPALIGIDHIMIDHSLTATEVHAVDVIGTDHRGLIATLARAA